MCKQEITFDKLPQAITYLTQQVVELKQLVSELQPPPSEKHQLVGIDDACRIIQKAKPTIYTLVRKGLLPSYKKGKKLYFYEDELRTWVNNFNRYAKGSEEQFWLSAFSGKPIIVDRRSCENSISVRKSFISVIGSIQLRQLCDLAKGDKSDNGFLDRILFVLPTDLQKKYWSTEEIPPHLHTVWSNLIGKFIEIDCAMDENCDPVPIQISYSPTAKARLYEWQRHNTDMCNGELDERLVGIYSKLEIYISRFSLVLQLIRWACGEASKECIDLQSIEGAITLTEYFRRTAQKAQAIIINYPIEHLSTVQKNIFKALPEVFTTAEGVAIAARNDIPERTFPKGESSKLANGYRTTTGRWTDSVGISDSNCQREYRGRYYHRRGAISHR